MTPSDSTRAELVRSVVEIGALVSGPRSLDDRMTGLCVAATEVLDCDRVNISVVDGDEYQVSYTSEERDEAQASVLDVRVPRGIPIVDEIERCKTYLMVNDAQSDQQFGGMAQEFGVVSAVIVPFSYPDGAPFGLLTADYESRKASIVVEEAELAMGMARIAQGSLLREQEARRRRQVSDAMLVVEERERLRLSSELHDDPLQQVLSLCLGLEALELNLDDPAEQAEVSSFVGQCRAAAASLREVMVQTEPLATELRNLEAILQTLVDDHGSARLNFDFSDLKSADAPLYVTAAMNRIADQAVRNSLQHADASRLAVTVEADADGSTLTVVDDGRGFATDAVMPGHIGLMVMRERSESFGGTFSITSTPGNGTTIRAWLPHT